MKKALFITVRMGSSRLTDKAFRDILDKPVLEHIILRAKLAKEFDDVIVCTSEREVDNQIEELALKNGVKVFRGSLEDKLERWNGAAKKFGIDYIVTFDGDDLFCDPYLLDLRSRQIQASRYDFIEAPAGLITGAFTYAFTASALKKVCEIKDSDDTEMMWTYFKDSGYFRTGILQNIDAIYFSDTIRMTLDYPEDFDFFSKIFEHFKCDNNDVPLREIVEFLNENTDIPKINYERQKDFLENQRKRTKLVLKK